MNEPQDNRKAGVTSFDHKFLMNLKRLGYVEGISTLILFGVAMPLKYISGFPMAVRIAGSIHGFLFVCLVVMLMMATKRIPISRAMAFTGMLAAIFPFGPFVFDRWLVPPSDDRPVT